MDNWSGPKNVLNWTYKYLLRRPRWFYNIPIAAYVGLITNGQPFNLAQGCRNSSKGWDKEAKTFGPISKIPVIARLHDEATPWAKTKTKSRNYSQAFRPESKTYPFNPRPVSQVLIRIYETGKSKYRNLWVIVQDLFSRLSPRVCSE